MTRALAGKLNILSKLAKKKQNPHAEYEQRFSHLAVECELEGLSATHINGCEFNVYVMRNCQNKSRVSFMAVALLGKARD